MGYPPIAWAGGFGWEKDLQFIATCEIHLPHLPNSVGLIHILGQPVFPEVVDQQPVLSYISWTPDGYGTLAGIIKAWPFMIPCAIGLGSAIPMVAVVAPVAEYYCKEPSL